MTSMGIGSWEGTTSSNVVFLGMGGIYPPIFGQGGGMVPLLSSPTPIFNNFSIKVTNVCMLHANFISFAQKVTETRQSLYTAAIFKKWRTE